jgi:ABC-2 type transport system ATP-binding protein
MRRLLRAVAAEGATVLISSHLLSEVEQVCDSVTIISRGRRVAHGPVAEVLAGPDNKEFLVRVGALDRAHQVLSAAGLAVRPGGRELPGALVATGVTDPARITEILGREGIWLTELTPVGPNLESVYLDLTGTHPRGGRLAEVDRIAEDGHSHQVPQREIEIEVKSWTSSAPS